MPASDLAPAPHDFPSAAPGAARVARADRTAGTVAQRDGGTLACRRCGRPLGLRSVDTISSHRTSEGTVSYVRCGCGGIGISVTRS